MPTKATGLGPQGLLLHMAKYIVILVTCKSKKEAKKIARALLYKKLIACANIIEGIDSMYWWAGKIERSKESLVIIKTLKKNFSRAQKDIKRLHSYDLPEIVALPIISGERNYLNWISQSV